MELSTGIFKAYRCEERVNRSTKMLGTQCFASSDRALSQAVLGATNGLCDKNTPKPVLR